MNTENVESERPRLFVSYSWTDQSHIDWVIQLATDLRNLGVEAIIDRWHLREGQDAHSFMESMVRSGDVTKAILVCDRKYVERANRREGGVGAESQIVTSTIFADVGQTKFVAIVKDSNDDGSPTLPNFLTSRIFIDFRIDELYADRLQQLVRWAFDKPLYREPEVGPRPAFLDEQVNFEPVRLTPLAGVGHNSSNTHSLVRFLEEVTRKKSDFNVEMNEGEPNDETIYKNMLSLTPIISQIVNELSQVLIDREMTDIEIDVALDYLSSIFNNYEKGPTSWSSDATKFFGQFILTTAVGRIVRYRRFDTARTLLASKVLKMNHGGMTAETKSLGRLNSYIESLEARNSRLKANRASIHSDLIREVCDLCKIDFAEYMQADLILYFSEASRGGRWWPDSLLYATDSHGAFPWFAKAIEPRLRHDLMSLIGVQDKASLERLIASIDSGSIQVIRWRNAFSTVDTKALANLTEILASYEPESS